MKNFLLLNFKTYVETNGAKGLRMAQSLGSVKGFEIGVAPSPLLLSQAGKIKVKVYAQHADPVETGAHTGSISVKELKSFGVRGTILNHSEKKLYMGDLRSTVELCKKYKLETVVCASTVAECKKVAPLKPTYIAYEPAALIGGKISVTSAKPKIVEKAVAAVKKISPRTRVLCGAGVHKREDVQAALRLGCSGVLIGHAVPKAKNPWKFVQKLLS